MVEAANRVLVLARSLMTRRRAMRSGVWMVVVRFGSMALSLLLAVVLARGLGTEGYGLYSFAFGVVGLLIVPAQLGMPVLLTREIARARGDRAPGRIVGLTIWSLLLALFATALGVGAWVLVRAFPDLAGSLGEDLELVGWAFGLMVCWTVMNLGASLLQGFERPLEASIADSFIRPFLFLLASLALLGVGRMTPATVLAVHMAAAGAAALYAWASVTAKHLYRIFRGFWNARQYQSRAWLGSLGVLSLVTGVSLINRKIDVVMLGALSSNEEVAYYSVAQQIAGLVVVGQTVVNAIIAPKIARGFAERDEERLQSMVSQSALVASAFGLVGTVAIAFAGPYAIGIAFGAQFAPAFLPLLILSVGQTFSAANGPVALILNMTGNETVVMKIVAVALIAKIGAMFVVVPAYGSTGAAVSTAIALMAIQAVMWLGARSLTGLRSGLWHIASGH